MSNMHKHEVPIYGEAHLLQFQGRDDVLSRFVIENCPSELKKERQFYQDLQAVLDFAVTFKREIPYQPLPKGIITP
jgi:hypothetical protein